MNRRQIASVLLGIVVFLAGVRLGLHPVPAAREQGDGATIPFVDPAGALTAHPTAVVLAIGVTALGIALSLLGAYVTRDRP